MRKNAEIIKSPAEAAAEEMKLINRYTRRELTSDEVYTFSVVLCDNEVDRDFERFTKEALFKLKELFLGKTGVFDHNPKAENQTARIYALEVEQPEGRKTSVGDAYMRLVAKAYLPRSAKNENFILMLDSGIQKEVSVGCAVSRSICSICGKEGGHCSHVKGNTYGEKLCYHELVEPYDAYEWSFVAIPAQRNAGVIKSYRLIDEGEVSQIVKSVKSGEAVTLSAVQTSLLAKFISELESCAEDGKKYKNDLIREVKRMAVICEPYISGDILDGVLEKMSVKELCAYRGAYEKRITPLSPVKPQLTAKGEQTAAADNHTFII